jgi:hypothetical protein
VSFLGSLAVEGNFTFSNGTFPIGMHPFVEWKKELYYSNKKKLLGDWWNSI